LETHFVIDEQLPLPILSSNKHSQKSNSRYESRKEEDEEQVVLEEEVKEPRKTQKIIDNFA